MSTANSEEADLLVKIYGCCSGRSTWKEALDSLCSRLGVDGALFEILSPTGNRLTATVIHCSSGLDPEGYESTGGDASNPRMETSRCLRGLNILLDDDHWFNEYERRLHEQAVFQMERIGVGLFMGGVVPAERERYVGYGLSFRAGSVRRLDATQRSAYQRLLPHFVEAVRLDDQIKRDQSASAMLRTHVERSQFGVIVCDARARVQWMNRQARLILPQPQGPVGQQTLCGWSADQTEQLQRAIALQGNDRNPQFLVLDDGRIRVHVTLQGCADSSESSGWVLVTVSSTDVLQQVPIPAVMTLFGLTESEARLASAMAQGVAVEDFASQRGITLGTARWHVKQILSKTGTNRQSELVRKLLSSSAVQAGN